MSDKEFETKVNSKQGYVLLENDKPVTEGNLIEIGSWNKPYEKKDL